ncbi:MAG: TorF family putative porin [Candidatus Binatia bacterium]
MRTTTRILSIAIGLLAINTAQVRAQGEQEPGGQADQPETATEVKEEDTAAAKNSGWLPGGLSGNVAVYSDYSFRGISQTNRNAAVQGGLDWNHDSGVFLGLWASPVDFTNASGTQNAYMESDWYGGYQGAFDSLAYKFSATYFYYPSASTFDYWEFAFFPSYDFGFASASTGVIGSPDYFGSLGTGFYLPFGFAIPIGTVSCPFPGKEWENCFDLSFDANAGYTHTQTQIFPNTHHYWDYNAGATAALPFNLKLDFRFVGTNQGDLSQNIGGNRFVFGAKYSF